jgi:WD40 repeat protein/serine/threonine protein kinase
LHFSLELSQLKNALYLSRPARLLDHQVMTLQLDEKEIFRVATSLTDRPQRATYVNSVCGTDSALRGRVDALLAAHAEGDLISGSAPVDELDGEASPVGVKPGATIGRYKILEQIGEGGFGVVYMADQIEPIQRRVAVKIVKAGMDTKQVIARFEAERQALGLMDHPNIAKVLDAGATENGRPYFVMELVRGIPINEYCDDRNLSTDERLHLFAEICFAVQHAHQKGIIHRDIKPSNIMVYSNGDRPIPKIIDFGIAKATLGRLTDKTLFTQFRQFVGTPAYMSPEQAQMSGVDVDTRSDIYSLGVLLYELLTGTTPMDSPDLQSAGFDEIYRRIREEVPPKPSSRLSTMTQAEQKSVAKHRSTEPAKLGLSIRQELDWIVMKAMEKDRARRYVTASALAEDVQHYLRQEPVLAVPPSAVYRFQKFARRNKTALASLGAIFIVLLLATVTSIWLAVRAITAEQEQSRLLAVAEIAREGKATQRTSAEEAAQRAEAEEFQARQIAYATDMNLAQQALKRNNMRLANWLLDRNRPLTAETDLRNWEWRALWQQCQGNSLSAFGDSESVIWSASLSPDGKWLATGGLKGEIRVWDMEIRQPVETLSRQIHSGRELGRVAFASQGDRLFATTEGGVVKVWNVPDWSETELQFAHGDRIRSISLSEDDKLLAVFGFDEMLSLWAVDEPIKVRRKYIGRGGGIQTGAVAISPNNKWLAFGLGFANERSGTIPILDSTTLEEQFRFPSDVDGEILKTLAFSPDSELLASGTGFADGTVTLWSISERRLIDRLDGHTDYICSLAFSPNGKQLASASADQTIRLWNTEKWEHPAVLRGHRHEVFALCYSSDGRQLVSGCKNGEIRTWSTDRQTGVAWPTVLPNELHFGWQGVMAKRRASFSHDGRWLATRNSDNIIGVRAAESLNETQQLAELGSNNTGVLFAPQERLLVVGDDTGTLSWLDPLQPRSKRSQKLTSAATICPVNFSSNGKQLLVIAQNTLEGDVGDVDGEARCIVFSVEDSKEVSSWTIPANQMCAALSPDGRLVVTGHYDGTVRYWQVDNPRTSTVFDLRHHVRGLTFSPDGKQLATVNEHGRIEIWDPATHTSRGTLHGNMKAVFDVHFSPDGTRLVTAGSAGESVKVWDLATGQEVATLVVPGYSFGKVEFSPDGNAILAVDIQGTIFIWRVPSMEYIAGHDQPPP